MGVYGYCVVHGEHAIPDGLAGIDGRPVRRHEVGELAVVLSDSDRPEPSAEHVQQHNAVIEAVMTPEVTPVPLRFGQWASGVEVFEQVVSEKSSWYVERLSAFAGALEFGLRVVHPEKPAPARDVRVAPGVTGLEYMNTLRDRAAAERARSEDVESVRAGISEVLGAWVREERVEDARTPHGLVSVSHLVSRRHFDEYREHASQLRTRFPDLRFLVSGPWMPYSFAV